MLIFSWCSEIKVTPTNLFQDILVEAFRRLPQRVVWKYEGDDLQLPPNVLAMDWVPQQDLLGELVAKAKSHAWNLFSGKKEVTPILHVHYAILYFICGALS